MPLCSPLPLPLLVEGHEAGGFRLSGLVLGGEGGAPADGLQARVAAVDAVAAHRGAGHDLFAGELGQEAADEDGVDGVAQAMEVGAGLGVGDDPVAALGQELQQGGAARVAGRAAARGLDLGAHAHDADIEGLALAHGQRVKRRLDGGEQALAGALGAAGVLAQLLQPAVLALELGDEGFDGLDDG